MHGSMVVGMTHLKDRHSTFKEAMKIFKFSVCFFCHFRHLTSSRLCPIRTLPPMRPRARFDAISPTSPSRGERRTHWQRSVNIVILQTIVDGHNGASLPPTYSVPGPKVLRPFCYIMYIDYCTLRMRKRAVR